jgi:hypothetical protein
LKAADFSMMKGQLLAHDQKSFGMASTILQWNSLEFNEPEMSLHQVVELSKQGILGSFYGILDSWILLVFSKHLTIESAQK